MRSVPNILAIAASSDQRHSLQHCLESADFDVITCCNSREGLRHLQFERFDLVLADRNSADIFGAIRRRQHQDSLPCVLFGSTFKQKDEASVCVKSIKQTDKLLNTVRELLQA